MSNPEIKRKAAQYRAHVALCEILDNTDMRIGQVIRSAIPCDSPEWMDSRLFYMTDEDLAAALTQLRDSLVKKPKPPCGDNCPCNML